MKLCTFFLIMWINLCVGEKTFICKISIDFPTGCLMDNQTLKEGETVNFVMDPSSADKTDVISISFWNSEIYSTPSKIFTSFPNLQTLIIRVQEVQEISEKTFHFATNLKNLFMGENKIQILNDDIFLGAFQIEWLDLQENQIRIIYKNAFRLLDNLRQLHLRGNKITSMSDQTFVNLPNIFLSLGGNVCVNANFYGDSSNSCSALEVSYKLRYCDLNYYGYDPCNRLENDMQMLKDEVEISNKKFADDIEEIKKTLINLAEKLP